VIRLIGTGADYLTPEIFRQSTAGETTFGNNYDSLGPV
jgi:hypothetical protein